MKKSKKAKLSDLVQMELPGAASEEVIFDGLDATFQNSKKAPLHNWFPYLEGFGPGFVESVRRKYLPRARKILDPFVGSGTTPLSLSCRGVSSVYCEANPLMREVARIKLAIARTAPADRMALSKKLVALAAELPSRVEAVELAEDLRSSYKLCFGKSIFFTPAVKTEVLGLRGLIDHLGPSKPELADALLMAVLAKLLLCSELKRAGDVRFKTAKEKAVSPHRLIPEVQAQLRVMALDCREEFVATGKAELLGPDARSLSYGKSTAVDGVITSPPYLNGTNYIRNTKLELWFARLLKDSSDLRQLRDGVVTSGINDVAAGQDYRPVTASIATLIKKMEADAYDRRIPRMAAAYFLDMQKVLAGLQYQTKAGGVICIDIGDSSYCGVHVKTDEILVELALGLGLEHCETVLLRARHSKDGSRLTQKLLVFRKVPAQPSPKSARMKDRAAIRLPEPPDDGDWEGFKRGLPHQQPPYTKRNWGSPLHSLCSYQGKLKPSIAYHLVKAMSRPGDRILDPFSGAGTIPYEAALLGRVAFAMDISTPAFAISRAKLSHPAATVLNHRLHDFDRWLQAYRATPAEHEEVAAIKFNGPLADFFHPQTMLEIMAARKYFLEKRDDSPEWALMMASMLHVLHGNRPYALSRNSHPITPFAPTGPTIYKSVLEKVREKVRRSYEAQQAWPVTAGSCFMGDITGAWPNEINDMDAIITSPPFFDSTKFYMTNWMRFWFAGWERPDFEAQSGGFIESKQKKSMDVYFDIFDRMAGSLRPQGRVALHLGLSKKCDMAKELSERCGRHFDVADLFTESVEHCQQHGVKDQGSVTGHQYLILVKR